MKVAKRALSIILVFTICFALAITVSAYNLTRKGSVTLTAGAYSVTSDGYGGNHGKGRLYNRAESAGDAILTLQLSTGNGWTEYSRVTCAPDEEKDTAIWGRADTDYLFRVTVTSSQWYLFGNPGRVAYGYVYTGL